MAGQSRSRPGGAGSPTSARGSVPGGQRVARRGAPRHADGVTGAAPKSSKPARTVISCREGVRAEGGARRAESGARGALSRAGARREGGGAREERRARAGRGARGGLGRGGAHRAVGLADEGGRGAGGGGAGADAGGARGSAR